MRVAITGSSGLIGTALIEALNGRGHEAIRVVRTEPTGTEIAWDPAAGTIDGARLVGVDAVVNLAGPGIGDHRWTATYKRELRDTRIKATKLIADALATTEGGPHTLISASGVNYYGEHESATFDEWSPPGDGFLASLCVDWEASTAAAKEAGVRVATIRTGIVLSSDGGALAKMLPPFKAGVGGPVAGGKQYVPWIHADDIVGALLFCLDHEGASGPLNLTAPEPVTNKELSTALGRVLHRPSFAPVPGLAVKALYGEMASIVTTGVRAVPARLQDLGYEFRQPDLERALRAATGRRRL